MWTIASIGATCESKHEHRRRGHHWRPAPARAVHAKYDTAFRYLRGCAACRRTGLSLVFGAFAGTFKSNNAFQQFRTHPFLRKSAPCRTREIKIAGRASHFLQATPSRHASSDQPHLHFPILSLQQVLCAEDSSDVRVAAVRMLFAAAVERAEDASERRENLEDQCNVLAAENQAIASVLAQRRAEARKAQASSTRSTPHSTPHSYGPVPCSPFLLEVRHRTGRDNSWQFASHLKNCRRVNGFSDCVSLFLTVRGPIRPSSHPFEVRMTILF